jgi:ABC-type transport system involved in multi-copper enzyme maturation permease subunit
MKQLCSNWQGSSNALNPGSTSGHQTSPRNWTIRLAFLREGVVVLSPSAPRRSVPPVFWVSLLMLAIWIVGLIGLALVIFQRQELTG